MADLSVRGRVQPSLFDRLIDDTRTRLVITLRARPDLSEAEAPTVEALTRALMEAGVPSEDMEELHDAKGSALRISADQQAVIMARIRAAHLGGASGAVSLHELVSIDSRVMQVAAVESTDTRLMISMARLRECVLRDLGALLNSSNLSASQDLSAYPRVASSVVNYGITPYSGRNLSAVNAPAAVEELRSAIQRFEPRLSNVKVRLEADRADEQALTFRIDADLWGEPMAEHLILRSQIDTETGDVHLSSVTG
jgi:type VI secretion system protein ImpF